jgi:hypothetical protein
MMFAAPPRARTGALEPATVAAMAATVRDNLRDVFMSRILVPCHPERTVTQIKRGKSVVRGLIAPE